MYPVELTIFSFCHIQRKATLLQEYNQRFKSNKFIDKRFGENDTSLSVEEKMMKRFAMERAVSFD